ncbi:type VII secretion-associated serine protease mycosin [Streptomyces albipurpureus]|uniref:Type VII secretion-associated serine protease mycosin n=1 Tax=Streptomyces albipurpureus TaxID=2897419 RepID=A0ABT0UWQ7_9ACTN|nr:type VII secretion-associated serine protease mycosin [Streptomyces sp. CWNU-1]MCM2392881.1 type VII secretion-associated serine protease mycosin [Streptomyces sp. CWNU-1]
MPRLSRKAALLTAATALTGLAAAPSFAYAVDATGPGTGGTSDRQHGRDLTLNGSGECTIPMKEQIPGIPWPLQRVLLDELWQDTKGKGVRVAVIDTGVDNKNPQLSSAVDVSAGKDLLPPDKEDPSGNAGKTNGTVDEIGHGTKVAGIIAARPRKGTGFVGLAPEATIIPIRQNDEKNSGSDKTMATAIDHAIAEEADVINISQDTTKALAPDSALGLAVRRALEKDIVVVASAGNDGMDGKTKNTYPAAFPGVLAVASSDRNNERAAFSQAGDFVGIAAPGVDVVSTVPGNGQCVDNGTSFSAPYVAGVAALLKAKYPKWKPHEIVAQIEQTAERGINGRDDFVGWGVIDPVRALNGESGPPQQATPDPGPARAPAPEPAELTLHETPQERDERYATYALGIGVVLVAVVAGTATVVRDTRRRSAR